MLNSGYTQVNERNPCLSNSCLSWLVVSPTKCHLAISHFEILPPRIYSRSIIQQLQFYYVHGTLIEGKDLIHMSSSLSMLVLLKIEKRVLDVNELNQTGQDWEANSTDPFPSASCPCFVITYLCKTRNTGRTGRNSTVRLLGSIRSVQLLSIQQTNRHLCRQLKAWPDCLVLPRQLCQWPQQKYWQLKLAHLFTWPNCLVSLTAFLV